MGQALFSLLICGDEVDLTKKGALDKAKGVISEPMFSMELKGIDPEPIPNYARFIFAGNHDSIIAAGTRERRFLVLEPSTHKVDDRQYWTDLNAVIGSHGANSFLHYLLNIDLATFNPFKAPVTAGLIDEKLANLKPQLAYIHSELSSGEAFKHQQNISATELSNNYINWLYLNKYEVSPISARSQISRAMRDMKIETEGRAERGNGKLYKLPKSDIMKEKFAKIIGHNVTDVF